MNGPSAYAGTRTTSGVSVTTLFFRYKSQEWMGHLVIPKFKFFTNCVSIP